MSDPLDDLVARFSSALLKKLKLAQANGRSGWDHDDWEKECQQGLLRHLGKGDPRDVAAYCAFMWHHGWATTLPNSTQQEALLEIRRIANSEGHPRNIINKVYDLATRASRGEWDGPVGSPVLTHEKGE